MALFHHHDTFAVRNQCQLLLTRKTSNWHLLFFLKTTIFQSSCKLSEMKYLKHVLV